MPRPKKTCSADELQIVAHRNRRKKRPTRNETWFLGVDYKPLLVANSVELEINDAHRVFRTRIYRGSIDSV